MTSTSEHETYEAAVERCRTPAMCRWNTYTLVQQYLTKINDQDTITV